VIQQVPVTSIAPDLRFGLTDVFTDTGVAELVGGPVMQLMSQLPGLLEAPDYLRYADRDAEVCVLGLGETAGVESELARRISVLAESGPVTDLALAVLALDAVDRCFREAGLWSGNIYLAGARAMTSILDIVGVDTAEIRDPLMVVRELAALELAYLFPVAAKFRAGRYDGQVQYRLNGWGRSLARRLEAGQEGAACAADLRRALGQHLAIEAEVYAAFLRELDVNRQDYASDVLAAALALPISVLV
jgi:hypothetical protein